MSIVNTLSLESNRQIKINFDGGDELDEITLNNKVDYAVVYGEFMYKAGSWPYERRLALSANRRKQRIDTVRLKMLRIAAKVVRSARYITFKLCSSCPYKNEFYETLSNISRLDVQLE